MPYVAGGEPKLLQNVLPRGHTPLDGGVVAGSYPAGSLHHRAGSSAAHKHPQMLRFSIARGIEMDS